MSGGGGWESVVGDLEDDEPELERTPPDPHPPPFASSPSLATEKPILDLKSGAREPLAQIALVAAEAPAKPTLTLPTPGQGAARSAETPLTGPSGPALGPLAGGGFSGGLLERLAAEPPAPAKESFFRANKEFLSTVALALCLVGGFVVYKVLSRPEPEVLTPKEVTSAGPGKLPPPQPAPAPAPPAPSPPTPVGPAPQDAETAENKVPTQPIISVMTVPSDARVEINGLVRGNSPLVMKSPGGSAPVRVRVTKNRFKTWEQLVTPNESGHFVVKVALEPR